MVSDRNIELFLKGLKSNEEYVILASVIGLKNTRDEIYISDLIDALYYVSNPAGFNSNVRGNISREILKAIDELTIGCSCTDPVSD